jgi:hypothetical protein
MHLCLSPFGCGIIHAVTPLIGLTFHTAPCAILLLSAILGANGINPVDNFQQNAFSHGGGGGIWDLF